MSPRTKRLLLRTMLASTWILTMCAAVVSIQFWIPNRAAAQQSPNQFTFVDQPGDWVPFSARFTVVHGSLEDPMTVGRYFRRSDGSFRIESGSSADDLRVISIANISSRLSYTYHYKLGWVSHPMILPDDGFRPMRFRTTYPGLARYSYKLALRPGEDGSLTATEGFDAYRQFNSGDSIFKLLVPSLNMFAVVTQRPDGYRQSFTDITIAEQPLELFEPPVGAPIKVSSTPEGAAMSRLPSGPK